MTTEVTLTGTGTPMVVPGLAGPGVLIRCGDVAVQVDAGRGTVMRLGDLGFDLTGLTAVLITHHHSDHMVGLADLLMTRWLEEITTLAGQDPLPVVVPDGPAADLARGLLDIWAAEIELRRLHTGRPDTPVPDVRPFAAAAEPVEVFAQGEVLVEAFAVEHHPVEPAVGYRFTTPDGVVVVSGDTAVSSALERAAANADVLVHEVFRKDGAAGLLSDPAAIGSYHTEAADLGGLAARAAVRRLVLTHIIPPIRDDAMADLLVDDIRSAGYGGVVVVGRDLTSVEF